MKILFGPVLGFRGCDEQNWKVSVLVLADTDSGLTLRYRGKTRDETLDHPRLLAQYEGRAAWRFDLTVPRNGSGQKVDYEVGDRRGQFQVPGQGEPLRLAYASCNGFSSLKLLNKTKLPNERWIHLARTHREKKFHLFVMGGDQIYSDSLFEAIDAMDQWRNLSRSKKVKAKFTTEMDAAVRAYYLDKVYGEKWSQPEVAAVLASVPTLMMWDDHDIFDGWGSYDPDLQGCAVYRGVFAAARDHFRVFQQQCAEGETVPGALPVKTGFSWTYRIGSTTILAPDLRSERSQTQVLSPDTWEAVYNTMDRLPRGGHLLMVLSIPLVYATVRLVETMLDLIPGEQELEDDIKDQWRSRQHLDERKRLVHRLLRFAIEKQCRVTFLSGDVHVPALGLLESTRPEHGTSNLRLINQFISSGIAHPPPPLLAVLMLDKVLGRGVEEIDRGITARLLEFPNTGRRLVPKRNWLSLEFDAQARLWANWWLEGEDAPYTKVVHPAGMTGDAGTPG